MICSVDGESTEPHGETLLLTSWARAIGQKQNSPGVVKKSSVIYV